MSRVSGTRLRNRAGGPPAGPCWSLLQKDARQSVADGPNPDHPGSRSRIPSSPSSHSQTSIVRQTNLASSQIFRRSRSRFPLSFDSQNPIRLGHVGKRATFMSVPQAASDLDHRPALREYDVRPSRQVTAMKSESEAKAMQETAHNDLRLCVLPPDRGHHCAAAPRINDIGQSGYPERGRQAQLVRIRHP